MEKIKTIELLKYKFIDLENLHLVTDLSNEIYSYLIDKSIYHTITYNEYKDSLLNNGEILGVFFDDKLIAFRHVKIESVNDIFLYFNINNLHTNVINSADITSIDDIVVHSSVMVDKDFRGYGLQYKTRNIIEKDLINKSYFQFVSTISPLNMPSLRNAFKGNFNIISLTDAYTDDINQNGLKRFILYKNIKNPFNLTDNNILINILDYDKINYFLKNGFIGTELINNDILFQKII